MVDPGRSSDSLTGPNQRREPTIPAAGEQGLAGRVRSVTFDDTVSAWERLRDTLAAVSEAGRLDLPIRSRSAAGRQHTIRDIAIGIGAWPEARTIAVICDDAAAGLVGDFDQDPVTDHLRTMYARTPDTEVLAAVDASIADLRAWGAEHLAEPSALLPVRSLLGTLPVLTLFHAAAYQLAVYTLDIEAAGTSSDPTPPASPQTTYAGVLALVDATGAIAARQGADVAIAAKTPEGTAATRSAPGAWRTVSLGRGVPFEAPTVGAAGRTFIEVTTGRIGNIPALVLKRELVLDDITGLLRVAPVLEGVPGLPGGGALHAAVASVRAVGDIGARLGRLTGFRRP